MWYTKLPKVQSWVRPNGISRRIMQAASVQHRATPAQLFSTSRGMGWPVAGKASPAEESFSHNNKPQPTESEEDVRADQSPIDPLHPPNSRNMKKVAHQTADKSKAAGKTRKQKGTSK